MGAFLPGSAVSFLTSIAKSVNHGDLQSHYYGLGEACPMKLDSSGVAEAPLYNPYLGLQKTHKESYQPSLRIVAFPGYFHCRRQREALMGGK